MERLRNIHIENYPFSTQELPVLALIKLYLSQTNEPIRAIDMALNSRAGLEFLIEKAKASFAIKDEYSHDIKKALAHIVLPLDCEKCARIYQDGLVPFLEDCRKELEKN